jgi:class 3 adenylate cyclase
MAEVAALQEAYYAMNAELNRVRSFVPQAVLVARLTQRRPAAGEDADAESDSADASSQPSDSRATQNTSASNNNRQATKDAFATPANEVAIANPCGAVPFALPARSVAVLVANVDGIAATHQGRCRSPARTYEVLTAAVAQVEAAVRVNGGVLGGFHGDHFTVSFNAVRPCAAAPRRACATAWMLAEANLGDDAGIPGAGLRFRVGVAFGKCQLGDTGTATAKAFSIVGPAFPQAVLLERLSRLYGPECRVLVTASVYREAATHFRYRVVDHVLLPPRQPTLVAAIVGPVVPQQPRQSPSSNTRDGDEWLYVFGDRVSPDPNAAHNVAFEHFARCDVAECEKAVVAIAATSGIAPGEAAADATTFAGLPAMPANDHAADGAFRFDPRGVHDNLAPLLHTLRASLLSPADPVASDRGAGRRRQRGSDAPVTAVTNLHDAFLRSS